MKSDGGRVCLDWFNEKTDNQPTVLMLPGITGMTLSMTLHTSKLDTNCIPDKLNDTSLGLANG